MNLTSPESNAVPTGFESLSDAKLALKSMPPPITETQRKSFIDRLSATSRPKQMAFRLLGLLLLNQAGRNEKTLFLLQYEITEVLAGSKGAIPEELPAASTEEVTNWVRRQFPSISESQIARSYFEQEQHLWTLFQILRWSEDAAKFMTAISALTDELEILTATKIDGKKKRKRKTSAKFHPVIAHLIKRIPSKPAALGALLETLRLCRAHASASVQLHEDLEASRGRNEYLKTELERERNSLVTEKSGREAAEARGAETQQELREEQAKVGKLEEALKIQAGAYETDKVGALAEVLAAIRRKLLPDLENIRLYADRSEPNASAIVRKAEELRQFLTDFKLA